MADRDNKVPGSVEGKYYVDKECIDCDLCRTTAENNFAHNDKEKFSYVIKQPATPAEEAQCEEALESCPVNAIGNDG